jgi:hypothetical protein
MLRPPLLPNGHIEDIRLISTVLYQLRLSGRDVEKLGSGQCLAVSTAMIYELQHIDLETSALRLPTFRCIASLSKYIYTWRILGHGSSASTSFLVVPLRWPHGSFMAIHSVLSWSQVGGFRLERSIGSG